MKKLYKFKCYKTILTVLFVVFTTNIYAQSELIIGSGTSIDQHIPMEPYYGYSYSQTIYSAAQMGMTKVIDTVCYYFQGPGWTSPDAVKIYMANSSKASFSSGTDWLAISNFTLVYDASLSPNSNQGWVKFALSTPFVYNGVDNLVIAFEENTAGYHTGNDEFVCSSSVSASSIYYYNDNTNPDPNSPPTGTTKNYQPNIKFNYSFAGPKPQKDLGILAFTNPDLSGTITPSSSVPISIQVINAGAANQSNFALKYSIDGGSTFVSETYSSTLNAGDTMIYNFTHNANLINQGLYQFVGVVDLTNDSN